MQIKLASKGLVEVSDSNSQVLIAFPDAKLPNTDVLVVGPHVHEGIVRRPGEYEFAGVGLVAVETKENAIGTAELFKVEVDGVNVLFVMNDFVAPQKDHWDVIGDVDVVVVSLKEKNEGVEKLINRLIPYVVVAIDASTEADAEKVLGLKPVTANDKFKFTDKDFEAEDPATILYLLK